MELIVASSINGIIGLNGNVPFRCQSDQAFFKAVTLGKICHVGYNTYQSVKDLKHREFVVIDRNTKAHYQSGAVVIGGAKTYQDYMDCGYITTIYLTEILGNVDGDVRLPDCLFLSSLSSNMWKCSLIMEKPESSIDQFALRILKITR